ncbi:hypothetical protein PS2_013894 [Malus domestica]
MSGYPHLPPGSGYGSTLPGQPYGAPPPKGSTSTRQLNPTVLRLHRTAPHPPHHTAHPMLQRSRTSQTSRTIQTSLTRIKAAAEDIRRLVRVTAARSRLWFRRCSRLARTRTS